jgi:hypothetical protein
MDQAERQVSFQSLRKVYGSRDQEKCSGKKTAREIAEMLKNAGVTQKSIILVWHTGPFDLTLLRELLESAGYRDVLPPQENCIPMINNYRPGLPSRSKTGKIFTCKLDQLFPVLFAGHELVGMNHSAAPDIQMLRLMVLLLIQLQKPPSERDLDEFPTATQEFVRSARPPYTFLDRWFEPPPNNQCDIEDEDFDGEDHDGEEGRKSSSSMVRSKG